MKKLIYPTLPFDSKITEAFLFTIYVYSLLKNTCPFLTILETIRLRVSWGTCTCKGLVLTGSRFIWWLHFRFVVNNTLNVLQASLGHGKFICSCLYLLQRCYFMAISNVEWSTCCVKKSETSTVKAKLNFQNGHTGWTFELQCWDHRSISNISFCCIPLL